MFFYDTDYGKDLNGMSEEEQLRLAIEESLKETENYYPPPTELSTSTSVSSMDTDLSSSHAEYSVNRSYRKSDGITSYSVENKNMTEGVELKSKKYLENYLFGPDDENDLKCEQNESDSRLTNCDRLKTGVVKEDIGSEDAGKQSRLESKEICDNIYNKSEINDDESKTSVSEHSDVKLCLTLEVSDKSSTVTSDENRANTIDFDTENENEKNRNSDVTNKIQMDLNNKEKKKATSEKTSSVDNTTISNEEILLFCNEENGK